MGRGRKLHLPTQHASPSVVVCPAHYEVTLLAAGSLNSLPSETGAAQWTLMSLTGAVKVQPSQCLASLAAPIHLQGWILLFLLGLKPSGFPRAPAAVWEEQRWQRPDLLELWFSSSVQSNLRCCHLSQLNVDTILNTETEENLLSSPGRENKLPDSQGLSALTPTAA